MRNPEARGPPRTLVRLPLLACALAALVLSAGCTNPLQPQGDRTGPGDRAGDYLKPSPYRSILVELDVVNGAEPEQGAIGLMEQRLEQATGKPVEVVRSGGLPGLGANHRYTRDDIVRLEAANRAQFSQGDRAVIYVMWLDGAFEDDNSERKILGAAYRGSAVAMFQANLKAASKTGPLDLTRPTLLAVQQAVAVHEMGHLLGLVNLGTPMVTPHEDPDSRGHSTNQASVMYHAVESTLIGSILGQNPPTEFDEQDQADLRRMRQG